MFPKRRKNSIQALLGNLEMPVKDWKYSLNQKAFIIDRGK